MNLILNGRGVLAAQYFLYFGVMGVYLPFFNLYCYKLGFSGWQIGALSAARSTVMIVCSIFWSILADRFHARRGIYIACNFASAALWALFLLTADFSWMLIITVAYGIFFAPLIAFLEAFSMDLLARDKQRYGRMRVWGSAAFIVVVLGLGRLIETFEVRIILSLILAGSWLQAVVSTGFPKSPARKQRTFDAQWRQLLTGKGVVFLLCGFLMLLSHGAYYTFFSIHLADLGYGSLFIGVGWAAAVGAEILAMLYSPRLFARLGYESVLMLSFAVAVLRWSGLWLFDSAPALLLLQLTHAVTYGMFHMASILYVDRLAPKGTKTLGQAVNNAVTYGLGLMTGFFISGILYQHIGAHLLFGISGGIALLGGGVFGGYTFLSKRKGLNTNPNVA
ncbi:MAG: MFS transporter [Desulfatitalea sp.]|nr:MFS transporter [Desulfatitalea sp.]NNK02667.1 MFS transporter [Desulfatitalea sp.]